MSAPPPTPTLKKSVAVPSRLEGPEHEAALEAAGVTDELAVDVINHALYGNPRPVVTNAQVQAILENYSLSQHASKIRNKFGLPAGGRKLKGGDPKSPQLVILEKIQNTTGIPAVEVSRIAPLIEKLQDPNAKLTNSIDKNNFLRILSVAIFFGKITEAEANAVLYPGQPAFTPNPFNVDELRGGFKRKSQTERFNRCVKMVRRTVTPRSGSNKESAAIAICTKTILQKRGRTIKRYSKKRLVTQRRK